jgi:hypothetical protein
MIWYSILICKFLLQVKLNAWKIFNHNIPLLYLEQQLISSSIEILDIICKILIFSLQSFIVFDKFVDFVLQLFIGFSG